MKSKERVLLALSHREPDRVPVDFGGIMETSIHINAYKELKEYLHICEEEKIEERLFTAQLAVVEEPVQKHLKVDVRGVLPRPSATPNNGFIREGEYELFSDEFGIIWRRSIQDGLYYDMYKHPLADHDYDDMKKYAFPDPRESSRFDNLSDKIEQYSNGGGYPVVFENFFGNGIFQMCNHLMGYDKFLISLAFREQRALFLLDKILEMKLQFWDEALDRFDSQIDIVKELDDMGTQADLLISPDMYDEHIKPRLAKLVQFIKSKSPHVKFLLHSCGSIRKIIPSLIEVGVDILNPVQYTAENMDPATLKKEFNKEIAFWGGGMDTQQILQNGSIREVENETKRMLDIFMPDGGFVFAQVHTIQPGVPVENMLTMWRTVQQYGTY